MIMETRTINGFACALCLIFSSCNARIERPAIVPAGAVFVAGSKTVWWQACVHSGPDQAPKCKIWNKTGDLMYDEAFKPIDGKKYPLELELKIDPNGRMAGPNGICLLNGRLLLPVSRFAELKQFIESLNQQTLK